MTASKNSFLGSFRKSLLLLSDKLRKRFYVIAILSVFNSILDIFGLLIVFPAINAAMNPGTLFETPYLGRLFASLGIANESSGLVVFFIAVFLVIVLRNAASAGMLFIQTKFSSQVASTLVVSGFSHYLKIGFIDLKKLNSGTLMRNIVINPIQFSRFVLNSQLTILSESAIVLIVMSLLLWYDPIVFIILGVVLVPITLLFYYSMKSRIDKYGRTQDVLLKQAQHTTLEGLDGFVDLFVYNKTQAYLEELKRITRSLIPVETRMIVIPQLSGKMIEIVAFIGVIVMLVYALFFANDQEYFILLMTVFALMFYRLMPTYNRILHGAMQIKNYSYLYDIVKKGELQDEEITHIEKAGIQFQDKIELKGISYHYPNSNTPALANLNLTIKRGHVVGIIGESGSGKTTLINILLRLIKEDVGEILIDNQTLTDAHKEAWLNGIGYVQQDVFIQEMSIARNVAFGEDEENIDYARVQSSLELANLSSFVHELSDGYNTTILERGKNLSGGQKQRLAIARSLYRDAKLIIFDEATSALDQESEIEINKTIVNLANRGKTIVIIAHRYSSLSACNKIYAIKSGSVAQELSYKELVARQ